MHMHTHRERYLTCTYVCAFSFLLCVCVCKYTHMLMDTETLSLSIYTYVCTYKFSVCVSIHLYNLPSSTCREEGFLGGCSHHSSIFILTGFSSGFHIQKFPHFPRMKPKFSCVALKEYLEALCSQCPDPHPSKPGTGPQDRVYQSRFQRHSWAVSSPK